MQCCARHNSLSLRPIPFSPSHSPPSHKHASSGLTHGRAQSVRPLHVCRADPHAPQTLQEGVARWVFTHRTAGEPKGRALSWIEDCTQRSCMSLLPRDRVTQTRQCQHSDLTISTRTRPLGNALPATAMPGPCRMRAAPSAMLRPTPPELSRTVPGTLVPGCGADGATESMRMLGKRSCAAAGCQERCRAREHASSMRSCRRALGSPGWSGRGRAQLAHPSHNHPG